MNRVQLEGFTGADAELKYLPSGQPVANLSVATSERYKDSKGADQEKTEWHRIIVFGKAAERAGKIRKGQLVTLEGKLQTRSWDGKDGKKQYITEVVANKVHVIQLGEQQAVEPRRCGRRNRLARWRSGRFQRPRAAAAEVQWVRQRPGSC